MTLNLFDRLLPYFSILVGAIAPGFFAYDVASRGQYPEKRIEVSQWEPIDALRDLSRLEGKADLRLVVGDREINNLTVVPSFIWNLGKSPILPEDYHEAITVKVVEPWEIVTIESGSIDPTMKVNSVHAKWEKINEREFKAKPILLNPLDAMPVNIYLTSKSELNDPIDEHGLSFDARITNLSHIEIAKNTYKNDHEIYQATLFYRGVQIPFVIVAIVIFQLQYIQLLRRCGWLHNWNWESMVAISATIVLSCFLAGVLAHFLPPGPMGPILNPNTLAGSLNWLGLFLNIAVFGLLFERARNFERQGINIPES